MTRLNVEHLTTYSYERPVSVSYNEARMTPQTDANQVVLETDLQIGPSPFTLSYYRDYWGTKVHTFDLHSPHDQLSIKSTALVEVHRSERELAPTARHDWDDLFEDDHYHSFSDYLSQSQLSEPGEELRQAAADLAVGKTPREAVEAIFAWLREQMEYQPGSTGVHFNAEAAFAERRGVCQDLSHIAVGALRSIGVPACYISGYVHPKPDAELGEAVSGESHAWLEWWDGRWHSWDPTNHKPAGDHHIFVGRGRDYSDVTPFKGILSGGGSESGLNVKVTITRHA